MRLLNLPIDVNYELTDVSTDCETTCSNCNMYITNVATIQSVNGQYTVGLDCASTLCKQAGNQYKLEQSIKTVKREIAQVNKAKRLIKDGGKPFVWGDHLLVGYDHKVFMVRQMFKDSTTDLEAKLISQLNPTQVDCIAQAQYA